MSGDATVIASSSPIRKNPRRPVSSRPSKKDRESSSSRQPPCLPSSPSRRSGEPTLTFQTILCLRSDGSARPLTDPNDENKNSTNRSISKPTTYDVCRDGKLRDDPSRIPSSDEPVHIPILTVQKRNDDGSAIVALVSRSESEQKASLFRYDSVLSSPRDRDVYDAVRTRTDVAEGAIGTAFDNYREAGDGAPLQNRVLVAVAATTCGTAMLGDRAGREGRRILAEKMTNRRAFPGSARKAKRGDAPRDEWWIKKQRERQQKGTEVREGGEDKESDGMVSELIADMFVIMRRRVDGEDCHGGNDNPDGLSFGIELSLVRVMDNQIHDMLMTEERDRPHLLQVKQHPISKICTTTPKPSVKLCTSISAARQHLFSGFTNMSAKSPRIRKGTMVITLTPVLMAPPVSEFQRSMFYKEHSKESYTYGDSITLLDMEEGLNSNVRALMSCLRAIKHNDLIASSTQINKQQSKLIAVPHHQSKLTMLLQPIINSHHHNHNDHHDHNNHDSPTTSVTILLSTNSGIKDYTEKKLLLKEVDSLVGGSTISSQNAPQPSPIPPKPPISNPSRQVSLQVKHNKIDDHNKVSRQNAPQPSPIPPIANPSRQARQANLQLNRSKIDDRNKDSCQNAPQSLPIPPIANPSRQSRQANLQVNPNKMDNHNKTASPTKTTSPTKAASNWLRRHTSPLRRLSSSPSRRKRDRTPCPSIIDQQQQQLSDENKQLMDHIALLTQQKTDLQQTNNTLQSKLDQRTVQLQTSQTQTQTEEPTRQRTKRQKQNHSHPLIPSPLRKHVQNLSAVSETKEGHLFERARRNPFSLRLPDYLIQGGHRDENKRLSRIPDVVRMEHHGTRNDEPMNCDGAKQQEEETAVNGTGHDMRDGDDENDGKRGVEIDKSYSHRQSNLWIGEDGI